jgi:putative transposase
MEYSRHSHSVGDSFWHIEWCTKYRYRMMRGLYGRKLVEAAIRQAAYRHGIKILEINVQPEHVHMVAKLPKGMLDEEAVKLLKGYSSWKIAQADKRFKLSYPHGHFWSKGYFATTIGYADLDTTQRYVREQDKHHA